MIDTNRKPRSFGEAWPFANFALLQFVVLLWFAKLGYCLYAYLGSGLDGLKRSVLDAMPFISGPPELRYMTWQVAVLRYGLLAAITMLVAIANRRNLRWVRENVLRKPRPEPESERSSSDEAL